MSNNTVSLRSIPVGKSAKVKNLLSTGAIRRRLQDIGLIEGTRVDCVQQSPSGDPVAYLIRGAVIALRSEDSEQILVEVS